MEWERIWLQGVTVTLTLFMVWWSGVTCHNNSTEPVHKGDYTPAESPPIEDDEKSANSSANAGAVFKEGGQNFDDKAVQRGFVVFGGLLAIVVVYLSLKFLWIRRKRRLRGLGGTIDVSGRSYGQLQTSEMNLLQSNDESGSDDDETHFQLPTSLSREFEPINR